eukprot:TRINITY_DN2006_c2_g1_i1.p2 TRINITY_DN2006_c2_g1~~TRINITY_DN2006_c2_g1_i1.p2  ORF type:complete len:191 (+),score=25.69 TRINITY_DN2006_c2_g1_i1:105-677(+)
MQTLAVVRCLRNGVLAHRPAFGGKRLFSTSNPLYARHSSFAAPTLRRSTMLRRSMPLHLSSPYNTTPKGDPMSITFINKNGSKSVCDCVEGDDILQVAHSNGIELEGACEGSRACSTCQVYLTTDTYSKLEDEQPATEEEEDMLDQAYQLRPTSRLGCCVILNKEYDGIEVTLPQHTRNAYPDGAKPHTH